MRRARGQHAGLTTTHLSLGVQGGGVHRWSLATSPKWVIFATAYLPQMRDAVEQLQQGAPPRDDRGH